MIVRAAAILCLALAAALCAPSGQTADDRADGDLPSSLTDHEFWQLTETLSEDSGTFHSDNFVSNEGRFQGVIPDLVARTRPGGAYVGVGPEQNFTYIAAVKPSVAFIVDIRRGNLQEHLLYKALFELSADRAEFLSRLFSRPRPDGLGPASPPETLFDAYAGVPPAETRYVANLQSVIDRLRNAHGFALHPDDEQGIAYVYRTAFYADGPALAYTLSRQPRAQFASGVPTFAQLMTMEDGSGRERSFLATEQNFEYLKDLETRNLIVPIVGDFGGPKTLRAVGDYVRARRAVVGVFYLSNVEQYLRQDGKWTAFCVNVASMPLNRSSTFIRSVRTGGGLFPGNPRGGFGIFTSSLSGIEDETRGCSRAA
jgi:hypothetical protein